MAQQYFTVKVPDNLTDTERRAIAADIITVIVDRTERGLDKNGKEFPAYSEGYTESIEFKAAGKSGTVDLTLSGEMLDSLQYIAAKSGKGKISIGYDGRRTALNGKVEGNITGSYGRTADPDKARDFLGISETDLKKIVDRYKTYEVDATVKNRRALDYLTDKEIETLTVDDIEAINKVKNTKGIVDYIDELEQSIELFDNDFEKYQKVKL